MTMKTSHGAVMSPRMERLWRFIRETHKIQLSDFSTDSCVERVIVELQAAHDSLTDDTDANEDLRRDIRAIMRRRVAQRVTASSCASKRKAKAKPTKPEPAADDSTPIDPAAALLNALNDFE